MKRVSDVELADWLKVAPSDRLAIDLKTARDALQIAKESLKDIAEFGDHESERKAANALGAIHEIEGR